MKIVVTLPVNETHKQAFQAAAPEAEFVYMPGPDVTEELLQTVDATIGNIPVGKFKGYENIKWVQLSFAGTDGFTTPGVLAPGTVLSNSTGAYGLNISEHMIAQLLMLIKKLNHYYDAQKAKAWSDFGTVRSIYGSTTLVVGLGDIGGEFARKMHALGSHVIGIRRNVGEKPEYLDALYSLDQLDELLPQADYVACSLPGSNATYHLFNAERFARMKEGAVLINVGRGAAVDSFALNDALRSGHLGGACVDVVEPEPLPKDHPLWDAPNFLLTPHVSGFFHLPETLERVVRIAINNLKAFVAGEPLKNQVDFTTGYRKNTEDNKAI